MPILFNFTLNLKFIRVVDVVSRASKNSTKGNELKWLPVQQPGSRGSGFILPLERFVPHVQLQYQHLL